MDVLSILLCDNQTLTRIGISFILKKFYQEKVIIHECKTWDEVIDQLGNLHPDVLILDYDLTDLNSVEEIAKLHTISPSSGILIITENESTEDILKVLDAGIQNFILKNCDEQSFIEALQATLSNRKFFSGEILDALLQRKTTPRQYNSNQKITLSELEIIKLITQGMTTKEIAMHKHLSFHTIITHRKNIFRKLGINNSSELMMYALKSGIIDSTEYYI